MSWTYSGNPATSPMDNVRFMIQDTDSESPLVSNEEILAKLAEFPNPFRAAAKICLVLAMKYARKPNKGVDGLRIDWQGVADRYQQLSKDLEKQATMQGGGNPYAGGLTVSDLQKDAENTDKVQPKTSDGQYDYPNVIP